MSQFLLRDVQPLAERANPLAEFDESRMLFHLATLAVVMVIRPPTIRITAHARGTPRPRRAMMRYHSVTSFARADSGSAITLMTPEPTGGFYKERGVEAFIRKFGYPDKNDKPDRLNFGGVHRAGERQPSTGLTMQLTGYVAAQGKITDAGGAIALVSDAGEVAAAWAFSGLLAHTLRWATVAQAHAGGVCAVHAAHGAALAVCLRRARAAGAADGWFASAQGAGVRRGVL